MPFLCSIQQYCLYNCQEPTVHLYRQGKNCISIYDDGGWGGAFRSVRIYEYMLWPAPFTHFTIPQMKTIFSPSENISFLPQIFVKSTFAYKRKSPISCYQIGRFSGKAFTRTKQIWRCENFTAIVQCTKSGFRSRDIWLELVPELSLWPGYAAPAAA